VPHQHLFRRALRQAAAAALLIAATAHANQHTAHSFAVTEAGAATLSIPIQVPRGIGGMEPQLALNYSSQAGNGLLGLGWNLGGPSAITRCPMTRTIDGVRGAVTFSAITDRFCLDGQRLVLTSTGAYGAPNSTYATERDSFSVITAEGSFEGQSNVPASFRVETKSGLVLHFGLDAGSRVRTNLLKAARAAGKVDTVNRWMLQRMADLHGSFVEFVYCGGDVAADGACSAKEGTDDPSGETAWSGSKVLRYIQYTNTGGQLNGTFAVVLRYEARPDSIRGYHAGSVARQTQRITAIETYRGFVPPPASAPNNALTPGSLIRRYQIGYDPVVDASGGDVRATNTSRIVSIQESDAEGNALPALAFTLPKDVLFGKSTQQTGTSIVAQPPYVDPYPCGSRNGRPLPCP
jgi:hypothetical protein